MSRRLRFTLVGLVIVLGLLGFSAHHVRGQIVPRLGPEDTVAARGVFHVHSDLSHDSELGLPEIIAAAKARDLDFVVLTDHNEQQAGPMVRDGVVVLSAAELSTSFGHLIQLGADRVLDKEGRDDTEVLAKARALGAEPIIAHPSDLKRPWDGKIVGAAGLEIANLSSSTRRRGGFAFVGLVPPFAAQLLNPELAFAQLYDRDQKALLLYDAQPDPRFIGLCGADAHGWFDLEKNLAAWELVLDGPMPLAEAERPAFVLKELLRGGFFCSAGLFGGPPRFRFAAQKQGVSIAGAGEDVQEGQLDALVAQAPSNGDGKQSLVLFKNGEAALKTGKDELRYDAPGPGTYRVEVWLEVPGLFFGEELVPVIYSGRLRVLPVPEAKDPRAQAEGTP